MGQPKTGGNPEPLAPEQLRWRCDPSQFHFEVTDDMGECPIDIIGQPRAMDALKLGFALRSDGYNIFVAGEVGTGRSTAVRKIQESLKPTGDPPEDLVYVHNFKDRDQPRILAFPAGEGCGFRRDLADLVETLRKKLRSLEAFAGKRKELVEAIKGRHKRKLKRFENQVEKKGFTVIQAQLGPLVRPVLMPMVKGKAVDLDRLESRVGKGEFDPKEFETLRSRHVDLSEGLATLLKELRKMETKLKADLEALNRDMAKPVVREALDELRESFPAVEVRGFLDEVQENILDNLDRFRELSDPDADESDREDYQAALRELRLPFIANVIVDNRDTKASPVIWETAPNYRNLFGTIERVQASSGHWITDHTRIKSGSISKANGGYLIVDAMDILVEPGVWQALKRALRTKRLEIQSFDPLNLFAGAS
ncbi:MAG: ATP-binding protein, partial [Acidobacteriota bacterium]